MECIKALATHLMCEARQAGSVPVAINAMIHALGAIAREADHSGDLTPEDQLELLMRVLTEVYNQPDYTRELWNTMIKLTWSDS